MLHLRIQRVIWLVDFHGGMKSWDVLCKLSEWNLLILVVVHDVEQISYIMSRELAANLSQRIPKFLHLEVIVISGVDIGENIEKVPSIFRDVVTDRCCHLIKNLET